MSGTELTLAEDGEAGEPVELAPLRFPYAVEEVVTPRSTDRWLIECAAERPAPVADPSVGHARRASGSVELHEATAVELVEMYRARTASPEEAVRACLDQIERTDPQVRAVITLLADEALEQARASGERYREGTERPLEGVPYGLKDIIATAGVRTTGSSRVYADNVPSYSATAHRRMDEAGAVLLAKLNTFPFAMGSERDDAFGPTLNPWDLERTPGGSSAGTAAAVAARQVPLGIGTDTGGSIRLPAAWCGVTGLKTTNGRVPRTGMMPLAWTFDTVGPIARTAEDASLVLAAIAGPDGRDLACQPAPVVDYPAACRSKVAGLRVAVPEDWFQERCDPENVAVVNRAVELFRSLDVSVVEVSMTEVQRCMEIGWTIILAELGSLHEANADRLSDYDPVFSGYVEASRDVSALDYLRCLRGASMLQDEMRAALGSADAILVPGHVAVAPKLDDMLLEIGDEQVPWLELAARHTFPFNIAGMPSIVAPAGLNRRNLPMGIQIAAAPFREDVCFALAAAFQRETSFHLDEPPLARA